MTAPARQIWDPIATAFIDLSLSSFTPVPLPQTVAPLEDRGPHKALSTPHISPYARLINFAARNGTASHRMTAIPGGACVDCYGMRANFKDKSSTQGRDSCLERPDFAKFLAYPANNPSAPVPSSRRHHSPSGLMQRSCAGVGYRPPWIPAKTCRFVYFIFLFLDSFISLCTDGTDCPVWNYKAKC